MGACCTRDASFAAYTTQEMEEYENEAMYEEEHAITKGEHGASIRLNGFSSFVSMSTQQGKKGVNQDSMTVWEDFLGEKDMFFCGIFDGHGPSGHRVSRSVRENLPIKIGSSYKMFQDGGRNHSNVDLINDTDDTNKDYDGGEDEVKNPVLRSWERSIVRSYKEMDKDLSSDMSIDTYCSGSTGVTVIRQGDNLIIGNVGDSRAIMCSRGEKGHVVPDQLTVDLKPTVENEVERITQCKGRVFALEEEPDVLRVWQPDEDCPGLAMTRAFGDFCLKDCGVISTPQLFHRKLTGNDEFVVLATDGIWDVLTNLEVVEIVSSARNRSMAAKLLIIHASRAWKSRFPNSRTDDIAVVCLFLKPPKTDPLMLDGSHGPPGDGLSHVNYSRDFNEGLDSPSGRDNKDDVEADTPKSSGTVVTPRTARSSNFRKRRW